MGNNKTITVTAQELNNQIPLFVKEGALIPMLNQACKNTDQARGKDMIIRHYGKQPGTCEIYEDDANTFDYQKGDYRIRTISIDKQGQIKQSITGQPSNALFGKITKIENMTK